MDIPYQEINSKTIDRWVEEGWEWGKPVSHEEYEKAKAGTWDVKLTPVKFVPHSWLGELKGKRVLGLASGGLLGLGIGAGTTRGVWARTTDLIFGVICEEWGFLFGLLLVLSFVAIAVSALVNSIAARSTFYSIAAVAAAGLLLFQTALNIFGITDVLPLTGVTLPFVSQGGSSMISCWAVLAFIKASDVRTYNYLGGVRKK